MHVRLDLARTVPMSDDYWLFLDVSHQRLAAQLRLYHECLAVVSV